MSEYLHNKTSRFSTMPLERLRELQRLLSQSEMDSQYEDLVIILNDEIEERNIQALENNLDA